MEVRPDGPVALGKKPGAVLLIACGALARELVQLIEINRWQGVDIQCLPAGWHNTPEKIPDGVRAKIRRNRGRYRRIFVVYGDCGTGGLLDKVLADEGVERLAGPHCYAFFSGNALFTQRAEQELTAFYLTDFLARQFDTLIWKGLGLHRHQDLLEIYFGNYDRLIYLAQTEDKALDDKARAAARKLGLAYERRYTGYGDLGATLAGLRSETSPGRS